MTSYELQIHAEIVTFSHQICLSQFIRQWIFTGIACLCIGIYLKVLAAKLLHNYTIISIAYETAARELNWTYALNLVSLSIALGDNFPIWTFRYEIQYSGRFALNVKLPLYWHLAALSWTHHLPLRSLMGC